MHPNHIAPSDQNQTVPPRRSLLSDAPDVIVAEFAKLVGALERGSASGAVAPYRKLLTYGFTVGWRPVFKEEARHELV